MHDHPPQDRHTSDVPELDQQSLDRFIALCKRVYERMEREGSWPWSDSPNSDDLVESEPNQNDI